MDRATQQLWGGRMMEHCIALITREALETAKTNRNEVYEFIKNNPNSSKWASDYFGEDYLRPSSYKLDLSFDTKIEDPILSDIENSELIYSAFSPLDPYLIYDEQFLVSVLFSIGYKYVNKRWADALKKPTAINHYFFPDNTNARRGVAGHAIGRLYLRAKMTIDPSSRSEEKYLRMKKAYSIPALMDTIGWHPYADNQEVSFAFFDTVIKWVEENQIYPTKEAIRALAVKLSMILGISLGEFLGKDELEKRLSEYFLICNEKFPRVNPRKIILEEGVFMPADMEQMDIFDTKGTK
jgi:hypothetical protein